MTTATMPTTWDRCDSAGRLVYWRRRLADGSYLAVSRFEDGWIWRHRGPELEPKTHAYRLNAAGDKVASTRTARAHADAYALKHRLNA